MSVALSKGALRSLRAVPAQLWARRSVRTRLTVLYSGLLLAASTALVGVAYTTAQRTMRGSPAASAIAAAVGRLSGHPPKGGDLTWGPAERTTGKAPAVLCRPQPPASSGSVKIDCQSAVSVSQAAKDIAACLRTEALHQLLAASALATIAALALALLLGWWMAGRVLRPLQRITATARRLSDENLHEERIALPGPADELKNLADTFDDMLTRLQRAFESQRRFVANASHELRTPLAIQRAMIEIRLANATVEDLPHIQHELLEANRRGERLIERLLMLAAGERGITRWELVRLDEVTAHVVDQARSAAAASGLAIELDLEALTMRGDPVLLTQLVTNLVDNAIRYKSPGASSPLRAVFIVG